MSNARIQFSSADDSKWTSINPKLREGELVFSKTPLGKYKAVVGAPGGSNYKDSILLWDEAAAEKLTADAQSAAAMATQKATEATQQAEAATAVGETATTKAAEAASSANSAADSASAASGYASTATAKATAAANSASAAASSESNAAASAAAAVQKATAAATSAETAAAKATAAADSASAANDSAITAGRQATAAANSASAANNYAANAKNYSENVNVFLPTVSDSGVLSWTNKAGLPNPASVNIKGAKGDKGDTGTAATIEVGTVTTGAAGSSASVTNSGTAGNVVLNFTLPRGKDGKGSVITVNGKAPDASGNVNVEEYTHPNSGVTAGTYRSVTVNAQGHVTGGSNPTLAIANGGTGATTASAALSNLGGVPTSEVANSANKIPRYNSSGHLVLPDGSEFWIG